MIPTDYSAQEIDINLQKYGLVFKRRWPFVMVGACLTTLLATFYTHSKDPTYEAEAKVLVETSNQISTLVGIEGGNRELKALTSQNNPLDTQVEIFNSSPIAQRVISRLNIRNSDNLFLEPEELLQDFRASAVPGTDVLRIVYEHSDPRFAANVVNTAVAAYLETNATESKLNAAAAQSFILEQLPASEAQVRQAESELRQFKEANSIVDLEAESQSTVEVLTNLENSLTNIQVQLADADSRAVSIRNQLQLTPQQAYNLSVVSDSPGVQEVLRQVQALQSQLVVSRTIYQEDSPNIRSIHEQLVSLESLLKNRIDLAINDTQSTLPIGKIQASQLEQTLIADYLQLAIQRQGLVNQLAQLQNVQSVRQSRAQILPQLEEVQRELVRKLNAAQMTYETLLENLQQTQVIANQSLGNARLLSPARVPKLPSSPSPLVYWVAGGITGSLLGIMFAFIAELLDGSVKTIHEGQELYDYPLLGVIPTWKRFLFRQPKISRLLINDHPKSLQMVDVYQSLQSSLKFAYSEKPLKSIVVTSAVSQEGTSEVVANLALTLSQLGHKVLVIDANMRSPSQHDIWKISTLTGLSNLIFGQINLEQAITEQTSNLHILPAGLTPPNPLAILESTRMSEVIRICEGLYDYIIIDTPAILGLPDMPTMGHLADGVLLVMKISLCDVKIIQAAKAVMDQSRQKVLGIVANKVKIKDHHDRYFYNVQTYGDAQLSKVNSMPEKLSSQGAGQAIAGSLSHSKEKN